MYKICKCCDHQTKKIFSDKFLEIYECINCRSLMINHLLIKRKDIDKDYYSNKFYNQSSLEKSLISTRKRQSLKALEMISKFTQKDSELIDFGFGRGAFLKEAYKFGYQKLIGIESSQKALDNQEKFFKKIQVKFEKNKLIFSKNIMNENKADKRIFVANDVIGVFNISSLNIWLKDIVNNFSNPKYLIIKTPNRDGLLFNLAYFLAKFKITGKFLHQLLQVGIYPPHYFYFSKKGLINLFSKLNYKNIYEYNDLEYEVSSFGSRLNAKGIQKVIFNIFIPFFALITKLSNSYDSKIILFRYT